MTAARKFIRADNPWLMFAIALAIRLIVVGFLYPEQMQARRGFWPFGYEIGRVARSLAEGRGYSSPLFSDTGPTAWAAPIYPAILAAVFKVFGVFTATSAIVMLSINSLFSALTVFPLCAAARRSFGEPNEGSELADMSLGADHPMVVHVLAALRHAVFHRVGGAAID